jgi:hypothetical protein
MNAPKDAGFWDDAESVSTYSRADAINDGVLVDVTSVAQEAGFRVPVALTATVHCRLFPTERDLQAGQSFRGRLWDVLMVLKAKAGNANIVHFEVLLAELGEQKTLHFEAHIGPGDNMEPVITVMFSDED